MVFPVHSIVYKLPNHLSPSESVYVEPLSCAVNGVERADIGFGDCVVVSGAGPIGLGMIGAARMRSPQRIVALDCQDSRLELARACGADVVLNPLKDDVVHAIREMTDGYGCDVYLEAAGNPASVVQGLHACRKAATYVSFSVFNSATTVDWTIIGDTKALNIRGGHCSGENGYKVAIDMLASGVLPVDRIVTHSLPLSEIVSGVEMVTTPTDSVKVTIDPHIDES
jgi:erythritol/L-threitol dehydrogenase